LTIRERVEQNVAIWLLGTLGAGFAAGFGAYETILQVSQREVVAKEELHQLRLETNTSSPPTCEEYGVAITQREEEVDDSTETVFVSGSVESLPPDSQFWLAAAGPAGSRGYWPRDQVNVKGRIWDLELRPELKTQEDRKRFAVFIVGKYGQELIEFYRLAMRQVAPESSWPPLTAMTSDMARCEGRHEVVLK
jgi:hypothetical protein